MASPFSVFRRNQTLVMAILVGVAIVSFVIAPLFQSIMSGSNRAASSGANTTLVRWRGGSVSQEYFVKLRQSNYHCRAVLNAMANETVKAGGKPKVPNFVSAPGSREPLMFMPADFRLIDRKFFAVKAQEMGIYLGDDAIDAYLRALTDGRISNQRMKELMLEQGKLSKHDLYEFLREELMVSLINMTSVAGLSDSREAFITPSRYWQLFLQFNQRAKIEAFPIMVEDYLAQVTKEPTDAELKETYDKGSLYYPSKLSPIAGFRKRYQANIEFVAGNMETFLAPEKAKVTEEQIKEAYDKQVAEGRFKVPAAPAAPNSPLSTDPAGTPVANPDAGTPPAPPRPPQIENPPQPESKNDQARLNGSAVRLVSFVQDTDAKPQEPTAAATAPAAPVAPATEPSQAPAAPEAKPQVPAGSAEVNQLPEATPTQPGNAEPPKQEMRTQTLEEVRDSIVRDLAFPAASAKMREALEKVNSTMQAYSQELNIYQQSQAAKDDSVTKPADVDLQKLADQLGLTYGRTGLVDIDSVQTLPIGKSMIQFQYPFGQLALDPRFPMFQAANSMSFDFVSGGGSVDYHFWKIEEKAEYLPPLEDVKEEVKSAWKRSEAQKLAEAKANELLKKMETSPEQPWDAALKAEEKALLVNPPAFSAMIPGFGRGQPRLATVEQVDNAGAAFIKKVFDLKPGQIGVASNNPQTTYYVVRLVEKTPDESSLHDQFAKMPTLPDARNIGMQEITPILQEWIDTVEKDLQVEWLVPRNSLGGE